MMKNLIAPNVLELLKNIDSMKSEVPAEVQGFFDSALWEARFRRETGRDLRDLCLRRDRSSTHDAIFESVRPLGLIGHIMPGNSDWTPLLALLETSVTGNTSWVKLPSGSSTELLISQLKRLGLEESVAVYTERNDIEELYKKSDAISAWGNESSLDEIRSKISSQTRFIPWGHRISFSYLTKWDDAATDLAEAIVKYEQQACSSPQVVYLEEASFDEAVSFAKELSQQLQSYSSSFPEIDDSSWAELSNFSETHFAESFLKEKMMIEATDKSYRIVVDTNAAFEASVLHRSIFIKTIKKNEIKEVLRPHRRLLQSAGISANPQDIAELCEELFDAGVSRVCTISQMQEAHPMESHDGEFSLSRFVKRVTLSNPALTVNAIHLALEVETQNVKISTKSDFSAQKVENAHYYFKSGGSTSAPVLSPFMLQDYHLQMQVAADGLIAAGLDPRTDRCMNLFFGGGLYGGFISFTDILEKIAAIQYPMAGYVDTDFVLDMIVKENVNVLLGMPSYLINLFKLAEQKDIRLPVKKIYFGGEPFSATQRNWLKEIGVEIINSASYGSVDAGPLGYQCQSCEPGVHHVNTTIQKIEIVDLEKDEPVLDGQVGRVLVSSLARSGISIQRYQIGDTAKWVSGTCECGDASPRLLLSGRVGDIFKFGGSFINAQSIMKKLEVKELQIELKHSDLKDCLIINSPQVTSNELSKLLELHDLHEVVELEKTASIEFKNTPFIKASSGKQPLVVDHRHG